MQDPDIEEDKFTVLHSHVAYQNPWIKVEHQDVLRPDGSSGVYGLVHFANRAVAILPLEENGDVWLVGQWRRPTNMWSWEIPEGGVPHGEELEAGAHRELEEEVGLCAHELLEIVHFHTSNSVCDEVGTGYLALGLSAGTMAPEPTEILKIRRLHFTKLVEEIEQGLIVDAPTLLTVSRAHVMALTGALPKTLCLAMLNLST